MPLYVVPSFPLAPPSKSAPWRSRYGLISAANTAALLHDSTSATVNEIKQRGFGMIHLRFKSLRILPTTRIGGQTDDAIRSDAKPIKRQSTKDSLIVKSRKTESKEP